MDQGVVQTVERVGWKAKVLLLCLPLVPRTCSALGLANRSRGALRYPTSFQAAPVIMTRQGIIIRLTDPKPKKDAHAPTNLASRNSRQAQPTNNRLRATNLKHAPRFLRAMRLARNVKRTTVLCTNTTRCLSHACTPCRHNTEKMTRTPKKTPRRKVS
jgi:hypothetical protein